MRPEQRPGRVVIITGADLRRGAPGGTRTYVFGLARFLSDCNISTSIVANGPADGLPPDSQAFEISRTHMHSTQGFQRKLRRWDASAVLRGAWVLHFQRPDDLLAFAPGVDLPPSVCTLHGNPARAIRRRRGALVASVYARRESKALPLFGAIIAVDPQTAREYEASYPDLAQKIESIPVAVDPPQEVPSRNRNVHGSPPTFLYAGRLSVEKRVDRIMEAIRVSSLQGKARLLVVGSGPDSSRLAGLADGMSVEFLGQVPWERLQHLYDQVDALVLASEYEGLPTVALEAVSRGCPVVGIHGIGLEPVVACGGGIVVPSVEDLPEALVEILDLSRLGRSVRLPDSYSWRAVGPRILDLYRRISPGAES